MTYQNYEMNGGWDVDTSERYRVMNADGLKMTTELAHQDIPTDDCPYQMCSIHGIRMEDGTRMSEEEFKKLPPVESMEQKIERIDHNMTLLLRTVQSFVEVFENNPMAKMFLKGMKKG